MENCTATKENMFIKEGRKEMFYLRRTQHILFTNIWRQTYYLTLKNGAMGRRIDPSWGGPIELFLVTASAPRLM